MNKPDWEEWLQKKTKSLTLFAVILFSQSAYAMNCPYCDSTKLLETLSYGASILYVCQNCCNSFCPPPQATTSLGTEQLTAASSGIIHTNRPRPSTSGYSDTGPTTNYMHTPEKLLENLSLYKPSNSYGHEASATPSYPQQWNPATRHTKARHRPLYKIRTVLHMWANYAASEMFNLLSIQGNSALKESGQIQTSLQAKGLILLTPDTVYGYLQQGDPIIEIHTFKDPKYFGPGDIEENDFTITSYMKEHGQIIYSVLGNTPWSTVWSLQLPRPHKPGAIDTLYFTLPRQQPTHDAPENPLKTTPSRRSPTLTISATTIS